jgi:hypothetical protein
MPIINLDNQPNALQIIDDYQTKLKVKAFEIVFSKDTSKVYFFLSWNHSSIFKQN